LTRPTRPTEYSDELAQRIVAQVVTGKNLFEVCQRKDMPPYEVLAGWLESRPELQQRLLDAARHQADALAHEVLQVIRGDDLSPPEKQVRIKGLMWLVGRAEFRGSGSVPALPQGRPTRKGLPFGVRAPRRQRGYGPPGPSGA